MLSYEKTKYGFPANKVAINFKLTFCLGVYLKKKEKKEKKEKKRKKKKTAQGLTSHY